MAAKGKVNLPSLRFTPYAWRKLVFLRDIEDLEVGGFGVCPSDDPLLVEDFALVKQECGLASVEFDDEGVADHYDNMTDEGLHPNQYSRIWIHTHPNIGAAPSGLDEDTFKEKFSAPDWAIMFILAKGGQTTCRLKFNNGPGLSAEIPIGIDYTVPFGAADIEAEKTWKEAYESLVTDVVYTPQIGFHQGMYSSHFSNQDRFGPAKVVKSSGKKNDATVVESGVEWQDEIPDLRDANLSRGYSLEEIEEKDIFTMTDDEWSFYNQHATQQNITNKLKIRKEQ